MYPLFLCNILTDISYSDKSDITVKRLFFLYLSVSLLFLILGQQSVFNIQKQTALFETQNSNQTFIQEVSATLIDYSPDNELIIYRKQQSSRRTFQAVSIKKDISLFYQFKFSNKMLAGVFLRKTSENEFTNLQTIRYNQGFYIYALKRLII